MTQRLLLALLAATTMVAAVYPQHAPAHHRFTQQQCERVTQQINALQSRLRKGYSAKQGRRYRERMRELELKRHRNC